MSESRPLTILCIASYEKGMEFMRECKRQGCKVLLLTSKSLSEGNWPRESLDNIFFVPDQNKCWKEEDYIYGVSYLARSEIIDVIVALDDYDVEKAAALREHLRIPGMGQTSSRYFRDKLAMRIRAKERGVNAPEFVHVLNYDLVRAFISTVDPPWLLKPRSEASATGIKVINSQEEFWSAIGSLGDKQSFYLMERYIPGNVYHVDSIISEKEVVFSIASQYGYPPMDVAHKGGLFMSHIMPYESDETQELLSLNKEVQSAMGLLQGVSHTEFIKSNQNGKFYFLETSARVGGAHIVELIEAATGLNLWAEWAKIEIAFARKQQYQLPEYRKDYAGLIISLARQEYPDTSGFQDTEIVWRLKKPYHVGLIVRAQNLDRVKYLLGTYGQRFMEDFFATQPLPEKSTN